MSRIVEKAKSQVGIGEFPEGSNNTIYNEWFGLPKMPWCGMFVSWVYYQCGVELPKIGFSKPGFAGCQTAVAYFKAHGKIVQVPKEGDIVFYDWTGDGRSDHTGIFVRRITDSTFEAIEGNTSIGNDSNGGTVMLRRRPYRRAIFVRP